MRHTIGTIPFLYLGGMWFGPVGVLAGPYVGGVIFGLLGLVLARCVIDEGKDHEREVQTILEQSGMDFREFRVVRRVLR